MSGSRGSALALLALGVLVASTFADALVGDGVFFQRDILSYWYPGMAAFRRAVAEGEWPLWNPHVGFGAPLLADASFQLAYPPTWLTLALPLEIYYKLFAAGHCLWAGAGTLLFGRRLGLPPLAAGVAGGAFALAGPLLSAVSLFHHYAGASWMPWVLAALEGVLRAPGSRAVALLGAAAGGQLLAGSGDLALGTAVLGGARLAWHGLRGRPRGGRLGSLSRSLLPAAALACALGAVQWLPTLDVAARSSRPSQGAASAYWSLHPASLVDLVVPRLVAGAPLDSADREELFEGRTPLLDCLYLGVPVVALAALALAGGGVGGRLSLVGAAFFLLAALGRHTAFHSALSLLPVFGLMRYPQKHLLPLALCVALAAGFGLAAWSAAWDVPARRRARLASWMLVLAGAALLLAAGHLAAPSSDASLRVLRTALLMLALALLLGWRCRGGRAPAAATALLVAGAGLDLVAVGRTVNPLAPPELVTRRPPLADALQPHAAESRVQSVAWPGCGRVTGGPGGWEPSWRAALAAVESLKPPSGARWGIDGAFDGQFTGLEPRELIPFLPAAAGHVGEPGGTRLLRLANVGHVLLLGPPPGGGLELVATLDTPYDCALQVLRVPTPLPRAYVAGVEKPLPEGGNDVAAVLDPAFDPSREVLVARPRASRAAPPEGGRARVVARTSGEVEVEAHLATPGTLVLVEAFDPGWTVAVDGRATPLLRANALFRGVRLEPGRHRVRFAYRPRSATVGALLALGAALGVAWGIVRGTALKPRTAADSIPAREEPRA